MRLTVVLISHNYHLLVTLLVMISDKLLDIAFLSTCYCETLLPQSIHFKLVDCLHLSNIYCDKVF